MLSVFWLGVSWLWQASLLAIEEALLSVVGTRYTTYLFAHLRSHGFLLEKSAS